MTYDPRTTETPDSDLSEIQVIVALAGKLKGLDVDIEFLEEALSDKKKERKTLAESVLVDAMNQLDMTEFTLSTGEVVKKKAFVQGRIAEPREAFQWLRDQKEYGIVDNNIIVSLPTGRQEDAEAIMAWLSLQGHVAEQKESVHHMRLKSFLKEALADEVLSQTLPKKAFGVYEGETVTLTKAK